MNKYRVKDEESEVESYIDWLFENLGWYIPLSKEEVKLLFGVTMQYKQRFDYDARPIEIKRS